MAKRESDVIELRRAKRRVIAPAMETDYVIILLLFFSRRKKKKKKKGKRKNGNISSDTNERRAFSVFFRDTYPRLFFSLSSLRRTVV